MNNVTSNREKKRKNWTLLEFHISAHCFNKLSAHMIMQKNYQLKYKKLGGINLTFFQKKGRHTLSPQAF